MLSDQEISKLVEERYAAKAEDLRKSISVLVFGPGERSAQFDEREAVREYLSQMGCKATYPESLLSNSNTNKAIVEGILIETYELVFVVLVGLGPSVEFSHYMKFPSISRKFRIFQQEKYKPEPSFLNEILKPFCTLYNFCYTYIDKRTLIEAVGHSLGDYVDYSIAFGHHPA